MALLLIVLVIIFQVYVVDFALSAVDAERQAAISGNAEAPCSLPVAG
jgi:hypothetical protein